MIAPNRTRLISDMAVRCGALFILLLASSLSSSAQSEPQKVRRDAGGTSPQPARTQVLRDYDDAIDAAAERASPAVVQIEVTRYGTREKSDGKAAVIERQHALGSGVIVDPDGYIITNGHVVEGAQRIRVAIIPTLFEVVGPEAKVLGERRVLEAKVVASSRLLDLALLKVEERGLPYLPLRADTRVRLGQTVLAIGSPGGLEHTVTAGIVSAVARQLTADHPLLYIQTDASINPGNSGGALVDRDGNLIGINTFIYSEGGGSEGIGFAIPAGVVRFAYDEFKKYGYFRQVTIGANTQTITPEMALGLKLDRDWGVVISDVIPGGPAAKAGLKTRDIVVAMDGHPIDSLPRYMNRLYLHNRDRALGMTVLRKGETIDLAISVVEVPKGVDGLADLNDLQKFLVAPLGVFLLDLTDVTGEYLPLRRSAMGAIVAGRVDTQSRIEADLKVGDVIAAINGISITGTDSFRAELEKLKPGTPVVLQVERDGVYRFVSFEME